jgi:hypothetical protein
VQSERPEPPVSVGDELNVTEALFVTEPPSVGVPTAGAVTSFVPVFESVAVFGETEKLAL